MNPPPPVTHTRGSGGDMPVYGCRAKAEPEMLEKRDGRGDQL
jgi:hypothetical protein